MGSWRVRRTPGGADAAGINGEVATSSGSVSGDGGSDVIRSRWVFQTAWKPPCNHPKSPVKPSFLNFLSKPLILEPSGMVTASASYTMMREADLQAEKLSRDAVEGSIADSFSRENMGRFKRVEGTHSESARGIRAAANAAWGRISRMRILL